MSGARFRSLVVLSVWKTAKCIRPKLKLAGAQTVRLWAHNAVFHALRTTQLLQMRPGHDVSPAGCGHGGQKQASFDKLRSSYSV